MPDSFLSDKTLIMIVGPSAIGKSTLMNAVVRRDSRFKRVRSFTTRPPRSNDEPGHYIYLTDNELEEKSKLGQVITDVIFPTTGIHYGTLPESFGGEINLLDTLAHSVNEYRSLPFKQTLTISLTANPDTWETWLKQRFPNGGSDMQKRLEEAMLSMEWSLAQTNNHSWLVNNPKDIEVTAYELIACVDGSDASASPPPEATALYERAKRLLLYDQKAN